MVGSGRHLCQGPAKFSVGATAQREIEAERETVALEFQRQRGGDHHTRFIARSVSRSASACARQWTPCTVKKHGRKWTNMDSELGFTRLAFYWLFGIRSLSAERRRTVGATMRGCETG